MPSFHGHEHRDTVFVVLDESQAGMEGMEIRHVLLFFSFHYRQKHFSCALINWFLHGEEPNRDTGMWTVQLECDRRGWPPVKVIDIDSSRIPDDLRSLPCPGYSVWNPCGIHGIHQEFHMESME